MALNLAAKRAAISNPMHKTRTLLVANKVQQNRKFCLSLLDNDPEKNYEFVVKRMIDNRATLEKEVLESGVLEGKPELEIVDDEHRVYPVDPKVKTLRSEPLYQFRDSRSILWEGPKQGLYLTKSIIVDYDLPASIKGLRGRYEVPIQDAMLRNAIVHAKLTDNQLECVPEDIWIGNLVASILRLTDTLGRWMPELWKRGGAEGVRTRVRWTREGKLIEAFGKFGRVVTCEQPLAPIISDSREILATESRRFESFYPASPTVDLHRVYDYSDSYEISTGFSSGYKNPAMHTQFVAPFHRRFPNSPWSDTPILFARALFAAFSGALSRALTRSSDLPVVTQAIATDGRLFHFLVFQLNSLDLDSTDTGVRNMVWWLPDQALYERCNYGDSQPVNYNPEVFQTIIAMLSNGA